MPRPLRPLWSCFLKLCTYQCKAGGVVGGRAWGGDLRFFKNLPSNSLLPLASMISGFFQTVRRMRVAWKRGNICSASVFFVRVGSKISPRRAKKNSNIPSPGRTRSVKCPTAGPTKTIKSPLHALPCPPAGMALISVYYPRLRCHVGIAQ